MDIRANKAHPCHESGTEVIEVTQGVNLLVGKGIEISGQWSAFSYQQAGQDSPVELDP